MRNWLLFDNVNSKDYGVYISGMGTYNAAERDQTSISIVGRNGDLTIDNGRYKNVEVVYPAFIYDNFNENVSAFRNILLSRRGYVRLEDTYHPEEYRLAKFKGGFNADVLDTHRGGEFDISFDCYPQRFLKNGERKYTFTASGSLRNSTEQTALPLIRAYGNGTLTIGDISITITGADVYTDIDCDLQEAYKDTLSTSKNSTITLNNGKFFELNKGSNAISFTGLTQIDIIPRWWIL